jgi:hypothetical protein
MVSLLVRQTSLSPLLRPTIAPGYEIALKAPGEPIILAGNEARVPGTLDTALTRVPLAGWRFAWGDADPRPRTEWRLVQFRFDAFDPPIPARAIARRPGSIARRSPSSAWATPAGCRGNCGSTG